MNKEERETQTVFPELELSIPCGSCPRNVTNKGGRIIINGLDKSHETNERGQVEMERSWLE